MHLNRLLTGTQRIVLLTLLLMILMRLVWMDLREFSTILHPSLIDLLRSEDLLGQSCRIDWQDQQLAVATWPSSSYGWQSSPIFRTYLSLACNHGRFSVEAMVRLNQGCLIVTIFLCVLLCRVFCRSWVMTLMVAAILLSRGRLIAMSGDLSATSMSMAVTTLWVVSLGHWLRTSSKYSYVFGWLTLLLLIHLQPAFWPASFAIALTLALGMGLRKYSIRPLLEQLRHEQLRERRLLKHVQKHYDREPRRRSYVDSQMMMTLMRLIGWVRPYEWEYRPIAQRMQSGRLLQPLDIPFVLWAYHRNRWRRLLAFSVVIAIVLSVIGIYNPLGHTLTEIDHAWVASDQALWWTRYFRAFDIDLIGSLLLIWVAMSRNASEGLLSFWEASWVLVFILLLATFGFWSWDTVLAPSLIGSLQRPTGPATVIYCLEPTLMTLGFSGVYNLLRLADRKVQSFFGK